ncbi:MAG: MFS transporter [Gammaproteobacteria bacterium]|nr:MFS transporter [Gammaproteobacteria bacterium]
MTKPIFPGWFVVGAAFAVLFLAYGLQFSFGVFVTGMGQELGWTRAETTLPYAIYVFNYGWLSVFTGRATDRFGPRIVVTVGAVLLGLGWGLSALVTTRWQLSVTLGLVAALGMSVTWVPCNATVARWFLRRRGIATSLASTGTSVGNFVVPPIAAALAQNIGWRATLGIIAVSCAALMTVAARTMWRDPETLGLWPDGATEPPHAMHLTGRTVREVFWTEPFLLVVTSYFLTWLVVFVPFAHAAAFAEDLGMSKVAAASVISAIGVGGIAGRLVSGHWADRLGHFAALIGAFALQAVSFVMFAFAEGPALLMPAAAIFGFSYGGGVTMLAPLCSDLFGRRNLASIVGAVFGITCAASAFGPYLAGWLFDVSGSYVSSFLISALANVLALAAMAWLAWRTRHAVTAPLQVREDP